jgi:hypothetical protein
MLSVANHLFFRYPFDTQECFVEALPWMTTTEYANITFHLDVTMARVNAEFMLVTSHVEHDRYEISFSQGSFPKSGQGCIVAFLLTFVVALVDWW